MRTATVLVIMAASAAAQDIKDVTAVFAKNCIGCHSTQAKMGGLDLQSADALHKGGKSGSVVVPGKSDQSRLFLMMAGKIQPAMPMGGKVTPEELAAVKRWIDGGATGGFNIDSIAAAPQIKSKAAGKPQIFSLAYSPDGKTVAAGGFKEIRLLDGATGKAVGTIPGHADVVRAVAFSKDGKRLAAGGGVPGVAGEVIIWDTASKSKLATIQGHSDAVYATAFSPDGSTIATSSYDKLIKLWDATTGKEVRTLKDHIDAVYALAFTPDGTRLISGAADRTVKVWDTATGERLFTLGEPTDGINTIAVDPTGKFVAAAGFDKSIRLWALEAKSGRLLKTQIAHEDTILKLAWSPDGTMLVSSSADKSVKVFRLPDLTEIHTISPQVDWVYGIEFAPDGKSFAVGRYDGSLSIYDTQKFQDRAELRTASR
jgi:WD40 repeat protein